MADNIHIFCERSSVLETMGRLAEAAQNLVAQRGFEIVVSEPSFLRLERGGRPLSCRTGDPHTQLTRGDMGDDDDAWIATRLAEPEQVVLRYVESAAIRWLWSVWEPRDAHYIYIDGTYFGSVQQCLRRVAQGWAWDEDHQIAQDILAYIDRSELVVSTTYSAEGRVHLRDIASALLESGADHCVVAERHVDGGGFSQVVCSRRSEEPESAAIWQRSTHQGRETLTVTSAVGGQAATETVAKAFGLARVS